MAKVERKSLMVNFMPDASSNLVLMIRRRFWEKVKINSRNLGYQRIAKNVLAEASRGGEASQLRPPR
mgnify:CR=1 FL=1